MTQHASRPTIALAMGDPAGISPELTAKLVALDEARAAARIVVIGDKRVFDAGAAIAGVSVDLDVVADGHPIPATADGPLFVDLASSRSGRRSRAASPSREGGAFALANYRHALRLVARRPRRRRVLHAVQQAGDAARRSVLRRRDRLHGRRARHDGSRDRVQHPRRTVERARDLARADGATCRRC